MLSLFVCALSVFAVFLVVQLVPFLIRRVKFRTAWLATAMFVCTPLLVVVQMYVGDWPVVEPWLRTLLLLAFTLLVATLLWFGYLQFYFSFERSPSLRFLVEMLTSHGHELTPEQLKARFSFDDVYHRRVMQMAEVKLILNVGAQGHTDGKLRYVNSFKGQLIGRFCGWVKVFMNLGVGG